MQVFLLVAPASDIPAFRLHPENEKLKVPVFDPKLEQSVSMSNSTNVRGGFLECGSETQWSYRFASRKRSLRNSPKLRFGP
jgi:hypothetical protein